MTKNRISYGTIFNYICVVFMLFVIITQFLPFFPCTDCKYCEDGTTSLADYVWFPDHHKEVKEIMKDKDMYGRKYEVADVVWAPIVTLAGSVLGIIFCLKNARKPWFALIPFATGAIGVYGNNAVRGFHTCRKLNRTRNTKAEYKLWLNCSARKPYLTFSVKQIIFSQGSADR